MRDQELLGLQEAYMEVYRQLDERENSPYENASDAALDARFGYGRAQGDKRSFGRAANRSSAAAALRAIRRGERSGSGTSREAGADAVHQGWARTAKTSTDQTPEKKAKRAKLANTSYSNLPNDEKEKDRVSFDAVRATYNRNKAIKDEYDLYELSDKKVAKTLRARERRFNRSIDSGAPNKEFHQLRRTEKLVASRNRRTGSNIPVDEEYADLYDIILSHLLDEGYAETPEAAEAIMVNMSEEWREDIVEVTGGGFVQPWTTRFGYDRRRRKKMPQHGESGLSMTPERRSELAAKRAERKNQPERASKIRTNFRRGTSGQFDPDG